MLTALAFRAYKYDFCERAIKRNVQIKYFQCKSIMVIIKHVEQRLEELFLFAKITKALFFFFLCVEVILNHGPLKPC